VSIALAIPRVTAEAALLHGVQALTVTPFFPSIQNPAEGCFIAEPIERMRQFNIRTWTIAVRPFYRGSADPCVSASEWAKYYWVPGNAGLATSGAGVLTAITRRVHALNRTSPIHLIHAHAALPCGEAAMQLAEAMGIPFLVSVHGLDVFADRQAGIWFGRWTNRRSLRVYQQAKRIVCISSKVREMLPPELRFKAQVISNGVDAEAFRPGCAESSRLRVLSVGNLIPTKGHALLLRAFASVAKTFAHIELEIIGEGPERKNLVKLAADLGISGRVVLRGRQGRRSVAEAMRSCSVFVLASDYEGLGCVYLEAMACGKPAIGCVGQGIEEIIQHGENGMLIAPRDEAALAETLGTLLENGPLRTRLGIAARATILRQHTLKHQAQKLADLYQECLR
jgi:glycosyltransferase involved in cell wall biosynthesis